MLNEKGIPTPLAHTMLAPPRSRMDVLTDAEVTNLLKTSKIAAQYNEVIDSTSAYEILSQKLEAAQQREEEIKELEAAAKEEKKERKETKEKTWMDNPMVRSAGRTAATMITRSLLGVLGLGGSIRRRRSKGFF
jgi:hypothetical protein